ncbi:MAG TPA: NFACT RNA binding domain-containing protein [Planctomycetota bacterium]|nr:NFACT RNA binding domain-containing protein [Planctomycetota bacterium]
MDADQPRLDLLDRGRAPLNLAAAHLAELVAETLPFVTGARVSDVLGSPPRDLVLVLEAATAPRPTTLRLVLSADADLPRLFLQAERASRHTGPLGPFFRRVAQELDGATLARLEQVAGDRIVRLEFTGTPSGEKRILFAELVGRHANLLLAGPAERLLDWLVPPPAPRAGSTPRLSLGEPWSAPPGRPVTGVGVPALAELLAAPDGTPPEILAGRCAPLSWRIEKTLGAHVAEVGRERAVRDLRERLERRLQRARALAHGLEQRLAAAAGAERVLQDGELLKANLQRVARGAKLVEVDDWFAAAQPATRQIALDPKRSPQDNVTAIFERFHKLERGAADVQQELERACSKTAAFEGLLQRLAAESSDPAAVEAEALAQGWLEAAQVADPRKRKEAEPRKPYREYTALRGSTILVGRSAADNDVLTLRVARGNDLWLHTRDAPGSHVVLRLERGAEPDADEVLDAATLAVHFSPLAEASKASVHLARRKEVHKPRGAKPGLVALSGGKTLEVRMQPERVRRLLSTARGSAGTSEAPRSGA